MTRPAGRSVPSRGRPGLRLAPVTVLLAGLVGALVVGGVGGIGGAAGAAGAAMPATSVGAAASVQSAPSVGTVGTAGTAGTAGAQTLGAALPPAIALATADTASSGSPSLTPQAVSVAGGLTLAAVTPGVVTRSSGLTVSGVLTAGTSPLLEPQVSIVRGASGLTTRQDVSDWSASTDPATGSRVASVSPAATLAAGSSVAFTVTVPAGTLRSSAPYGVLPLAVEVTSDQGVSSLHTFVGWYARKEYEQLDLAVVAPVTLPADTALYADDATVRARAWQRDLGAGSRVDRLLRGTDVPGASVTWAVDPAVIGAISGGTPGASTGPGGSTPSTATPSTSASSTPAPSTPASSAPLPKTPPTSSPAPTTTDPSPAGPDLGPDPVEVAQEQLATRLAQGATRHPVWSLPYADPDLAATLVSPSDPLVTTAIQRGAALSGRLGGVKVTNGMAWPVDGALPTDREKALRTAYGSGLTGALVSSSTLPGTTGFSATAPHRSPTGLSVLGWDDTLSSLTTRTRSSSDGVLATQELVAQTATLLGQSPGVPRSFVIALPRTVDPSADALRSMLTGLAAVPWVRMSSADSMVVAAATSGENLLSMATSTWPVTQPGITPALRRRVDPVRRAVKAVTTLLPRRVGVLGLYDDSLDQVVSARWRGDPAGAAALVDSASTWARTATSGIRVVGQDTNFLADEGILQVTVVNDLSEPVAGLLLRLSPSSPRLIVLEQPAAFPIAARSRAQVRVRVRAVAAGLVPVTVSLQSSDGTSVGTSAQLNIRANPPGRAFYLVSGGVLVVLVLFGVLRSVRQRRRTPPAP